MAQKYHKKQESLLVETTETCEHYPKQRSQSSRNSCIWLTRTILQSKNRHSSSFQCPRAPFFSMEEEGKENEGALEKGLLKWLLLLVREDLVKLLLYFTACQQEAPYPLLPP